MVGSLGWFWLSLVWVWRFWVSMVWVSPLVVVDLKSKMSDFILNSYNFFIIQWCRLAACRSD